MNPVEHSTPATATTSPRHHRSASCARGMASIAIVILALGGGATMRSAAAAPATTPAKYTACCGFTYRDPSIAAGDPLPDLVRKSDIPPRA